MQRVPVTFAAVLALATVFATCRAQAEEIPVSGEIVGAAYLGPPELNFIPGGILIVDGLAEEFLTGDLTPSMIVSSTFLVHQKTGEGLLFGDIDWQDPDNEGSGFHGPFSGNVTGAVGPGEGSFDGQWELHGYGVYQGETAQIDNYGPLSGAPQVYEGVIHVPNGQ